MPKRVARNRQAKIVTVETDVIPMTGASGVVPIALLGTGTPDGTRFLRDDNTLAVPSGSSGGNLVYGGGVDGSITFGGSTPVAGATLTAGVYTMTRDIYATDIAISATYIINTMGYKLFASGTITVGVGTYINREGIHNTTPTATGAAALTATTLGGAGVGGSGGTTDGGNVSSLGSRVGSKGGAGGAGAGGAGGTVSDNTDVVDSVGGVRVIYSLMGALSGRTQAGSSFDTHVAGGQGGAGGGGNGPGQSGGGGGGGGGILLVAAKNFAITASGTLVMSANGGVGSAGVGTNSGGGGGGGGGASIVITSTALPSGVSQSSAGGAGGAPTGTGVAGTAGTAGRTVLLIN